MKTAKTKIISRNLVALAVCSACILAQIERCYAESSHSSEQKDASKAEKKQEADNKRQIKEQEAVAERTRAKQLSEAQAKFEQARAAQKEAPAEYVNAVAALASAYQSSNNLSQANKYYILALQQLESNFPDSELQKINIYSLWNLLRVVPESEFYGRFERLVQLTDQKFPADAESMVLNGIRDRQYGSQLDREAQIADRKKLLEIAIKVCSSIRGADDRRLAPLIRQYGNEFEAGDDVTEAEKYMRRSFDLTRPLTDEIKASQQIELAQFYLRHQMREKMNDAFNNAIALCHGHIPQSVAYSFSFLTRAYSTSSYGGNPEKMISTLLANGDDDLIRILEPQIDTMVNNYISSGSLSRAENLIRQRVNASERCKNDPDANAWRVRLSDTLLAMGREAESDKLFEQVRAATVLAGGSVTQIESHRAELLERLGKGGSKRTSK
jgi:hypothetical protein